ncbi:dihydroxyacetone kinase subunit DhaK [Cetobacterium sp.]|uniref:dihydroxyacetone kinase subunit DhaK n=1 Tax=Cetobacterium sp. TaxID=2071632 RepID=UPI003F2CCA5E
MKKIMNDPKNIVSEMLEGLSILNKDLLYHPEFEVVSRVKTGKKKVGIVSGGGSGHEPAHAGYVGLGLLDAAVAGNVFASPDPMRILKGIKEADNGAGVLLVIKNYSGDIMNFDMAKDLAELEGIKVESVVVKDDVAVEDSEYSDGRRGIAGTIFVHKVAGAMAERGASLDEVKRVAQKAIKNIRSMGVSMSSCTLPAASKENFTLEVGKMEIGMGIHGEKGIVKDLLKTSKDIATILLEKIMNDLDYYDSEIALMINGLGATPLMELYVLNNDVRKILLSKNIVVKNNMVGNFMTALDMTGCSITLFKLDTELEDLLNEKCKSLALNI